MHECFLRNSMTTTAFEYWKKKLRGYMKNGRISKLFRIFSPHRWNGWLTHLWSQNSKKLLVMELQEKNTIQRAPLYFYIAKHWAIEVGENGDEQFCVAAAFFFWSSVISTCSKSLHSNLFVKRLQRIWLHFCLISLLHLCAMAKLLITIIFVGSFITLWIAVNKNFIGPQFLHNNKNSFIGINDFLTEQLIDRRHQIETKAAQWMCLWLFENCATYLDNVIDLPRTYR